MANVFVYLGYVAVLALLFFRFAFYENKKRARNLLLLISFVVIGAAIFAIQGVSQGSIVMLVLGILIFNGMLVSYGSRMSFLYLIVGAFYLYAVVMLVHVGYRVLAQAMLIGTLNEISMLKSFKERIGNSRLERRRDVIQIIFGLLIIFAYYYFPAYVASYSIILTIVIGIALIDYAKVYHDAQISRLIYSLERRNTALGHGALWLAAGALVAISFLNAPSIVIVFSAIFIADALATIVGVSVRTVKLPWNSHKSLGGTLVYFATVAIISYPIASVYAIPVAILAALVESIDWRIDDNIAVSFILTAAILIAKTLVTG
jgi:dolichol kinase